MQKMLKAPIARMGGKSKLRKIIIDMIPEHICYVELFSEQVGFTLGKNLVK